MAFDKELYKALKAGLADLTEPQNQALRLIWENPNVPVYNLPIKIGRQPSGYVWLAVGAGIKTKLWRRMPPQIKREVQPPGYLPFYVGLLVRLYTVEDRHQRRLKVFELHAEAVKALQELKIIGTKRDQPSPDYKRLDKMEDDEVPTGFSAPAERKRVNLAIIARRGQQKFREALLSAYGGRCAVTGCDERNVLEAAHIIGFRDRGRYEASNGILLRADWHTLFDLGLWTINPERLTIVLSANIKEKEYAKFRGRRITIPDDTRYAPSREALKRRYKRFRKTAHAAR
jgi:HNH endonuclease